MSRPVSPDTVSVASSFRRLLPVLAGLAVVGCSLAIFRFYQEEPNVSTSLAIAWLISLSRGLIVGFLVWMTQGCMRRRRELAAANEELARINKRLKDEVRKTTQAEQRFEVLFSENPLPMWVFDCTTLAITDVNHAAVRQYGYTREEFLKLTALDLRPDEEKRRFLARVQSAERGHGFRGIWRHQRKDGTCLYVDICMYRFQAEGGERELVLAKDVTAAVDAKEALHRSEAALQSLFSSAPFGICNTSLKRDCFLDFNPAMLQMLGYTREEMLALKLSTHLYPDPSDRARMLELLKRSGRLDGYEATLLRKDGKAIRVRGWGVLKTSPEGELDLVDVYVQDLTEQSALEQQIQRVQKLEAVGRLAGGIAHDFNNILVVIRLSTELMLAQVHVDSSFSKPLLQVLNAADRAAALTKQLLAFGRQQVMQSRILNLNSVVVDTMHMLRRTIGEDIQLTTRLEENLQNTKLDPDQLAQVIMNLAINARDAMPRGGSLHIETQNVELDESYAKAHGPVRPGKYVMLVVSDTGSGIPKEILPRIFDPFFTTKEVGKGTGLGLSIVYGIVKQSGGYIWVYSEPEQGTAFKLYFPVSQKQAEPVLLPGISSASTGGTILVVEDEKEIRHHLRECLQQLGYEVLEAVDGVDALQVYAACRGKVDLVLSDLVMPRMGGHELAKELLRLDPALSICFMSGYTENSAARREILDEGSPFLTKPFSVADLASAVQRALSLRSLNASNAAV